MDNISHTLTGLVLAQAGLRRVSARATAVLLVSANAPDLDIVAATGGSLRYLEAHRGYTHSILFLPVMALVSVLLVAALFRSRLDWLRLWMLACLGIASHLLLDFTNSYGIRLGLPFTSRWYHGDLNGLYDGFFIAVLLISALWPVLANLVSGEIGARAASGMGVARAAIVAILLFESGRVVLHARAVGILQTRIYEEEQPVRVAALPDAFNPFRWVGIVETPRAFFRVLLPATGEPEWREMQTFYKPPQSPAWIAVKKEESFRFYSYFARFPVWAFVPVSVNNGRGLQVDLTDLRFGSPGSGSFHCFALLDNSNRVLDQRFSWSSEP